MKHLRHLLFAVVLLLTQTGLLAHGFEHLRIDADMPASHGCALCLVAQGLDAQPAPASSAVGVTFAGFMRPLSVTKLACVTPVVFPRARAPPTIL